MVVRIKDLPLVKGGYIEDFEIARNTWFGVGGKVDVLYKPADVEDLCVFFRELPVEYRDRTIVLGACSNVIIRDGGIRGIVIKLQKFSKIQLQNGVLRVGAGVLCQTLANFAYQNSIEGLEFLDSIPGSVGGAIYMNAGCYGSEIKDVLISAKFVDYDGNLHSIKNEDFGFFYRGSDMQSKKLVFVEGEFRCQMSQNREEIFEKIALLRENRKNSQPTRVKTGGSTFKNKPQYKAWELIDKAGCRNLQIGDARMAEKHCNFMVNLGDATAADLENLGEEIRKIVDTKTGERLEWEVKIIGNKKT